METHKGGRVYLGCAWWRESRDSDSVSSGSEDDSDSDTDKSEEGGAPSDAGEEGEAKIEERELRSCRIPKKRKPQK